MKMPRKSVDNDETIKLEEKEDKGDILESMIGSIGPWQIWVIIWTSLLKFPVAWHQLSYTFIAATTPFKCSENTTDVCSANCSSIVYDRSIFSNTIITQWNLVCDRAYLADVSQTFALLGFLIGSIVFGYLADRYGRRIPLIASVILQGVCGILTAVVPWFHIFMILRFLVVFACGGTMTTSFVLLMELVGTKWRTSLCVLGFLPFNVGYLLLPLISYFIRDWKYFQIALSIPSLLMVSYYWLLPESPRYLLTARREDEVIRILERAASINKLPTDDIIVKVKRHLYETSDRADEQARESGSFVHLLKTPRMRVNTLCLWFIWLEVGLGFYGVAYFAGKLNGNIFVNVALIALIQIPGVFASLWGLPTLGRRMCTFISNILTAASLLTLALIPYEFHTVRIILSACGMFSLSFAFVSIYIYSGELFPTVVRNIGVGMVSMFARFGSMLAPHIVSLVVVKVWLPPLIFGILPLFGAFLCLLLPETLNCKLMGTVEELEEFCNDYRRRRRTRKAIGSISSIYPDLSPEITKRSK